MSKPEINQSPISANAYLTLPDEFYDQTPPTPGSAPKMVELNRALINEYGLPLKWFNSPEATQVLCGNQSDPNNLPVGLAYAGHQFGNWVPLLGDGRAHMLGQIKTQLGHVDVQLKGSGRTAYSRGGDGRATLASVLREYLVSEAMAGLNIPTTRSLAILLTGDYVYRERPEPGAVLVRTATSHIRVGSFQFAASQSPDHVKALADYMLEHHFKELDTEHERGPTAYRALLDECISRQAKLVAQWMLVGFIHGVMNTDNTSLIGETIDYGPCAFIDEFHPHKVFSSIDRQGRYAWQNQASIAVWNLTRFAETLLALLDDNENTAIELAQNSLATFSEQFDDLFHSGFERKLGLGDDKEVHKPFIQQTLSLLSSEQLDFTVFFDRLTEIADGASVDRLTDSSLAANSSSSSSSQNIDHWTKEWQQLRLKSSIDATAMRCENPALIARNHRVQEALDAATDEQDYGPFRRLAKALAKPYEIAPDDIELQQPPSVEQRVSKTYCGT